MGDKEKQNGLSTIKKGRAGEVGVEGDSLMCCKEPALTPEAMVKSLHVLLLRAMYGSMAIQQQGGSVSMSMVHIITKGHKGDPILPPRMTFIPTCCTELALPLNGWSI